MNDIIDTTPASVPAPGSCPCCACRPCTCVDCQCCGCREEADGGCRCD